MGIDVAHLQSTGEVSMARMHVKSMGGRYVVSLSGSLSGRDLRRLERLCGPALEQPTIPLTLCLSSRIAIDRSAQAYLNRLEARGAVVRVD